MSDFEKLLSACESTEEGYLKAHTHHTPMDNFEKLLLACESTEEGYLKQIVGAGYSVVDSNDYSESENEDYGNEEQGETVTLPGAIKAMDDIKVDENASLIERRHIGSTLGRGLRFGKKKESSHESDARTSKTNSASTTSSRDTKSSFVGNNTRDHNDDDDNNTVDEMIEASEREEETNLNNIFELIPANSDPLATAVSTKDIRMNISKTLHDRETSHTNNNSSNKNTLIGTMNNLFSSKRRLQDGNDSLAGNETIGKIVTHMMDTSTKTGGEEERTLRSWTDVQPIAGSVGTPMGKISITTGGDSNRKNSNANKNNNNNKFVDDETSVGNISEEIEVIVAKHNRRLDEEVGAIKNMEKGEAVTIANNSTMISSLSFDATYYASRARSLLGVAMPPATDEIADTTPPTFKIVGEVTDEDNGGDNDDNDDGDGDDDVESRESEPWWVLAEKAPSTPMRLSDKTPSPQNSVGKSSEAPGTPSTVILPGHLLGLATPTPSEMDAYEYEDDQYTRKSNGTNVGRKKITSTGHLTFFKRVSDKYGRFYVLLILGAVVMLIFAAILVIGAFAMLGKSDEESNESPRPPSLILPPEETSNIFDFDLEDGSTQIDPATVSPDQSMIEDTDPATVSPDQSVIEGTDPATVAPDQSVIEGTDPATVAPDQSVIEDTDPATAKPTINPTRAPIISPTHKPSKRPSERPTERPTKRPTERPTERPTDQPQTSETFAIFYERLRQTVSQRLPESLPKLEDPSSPQFRALEWLKSNSPTVEEMEVKPIAQKYVLAVLYFTTNGEEWLDNTGWLSSDDECEWFSTSSGGTNKCDRSGRVIEIDLRSNNLNGILPSELVLLSENITRIRVNGNSLRGRFPSFLGEMTNLVRFHAHYNFLSGTVPTNLGELSSSLLSLRVGHNEFVGTIPWQLSDLQSLEALGFASNELTGTIPSFLGDLPNLSELNLSKNDLSGTIPFEFTKFKSLVILSLERNDLTGSMPTEVCSSLPFLEIAKVDCNEVSCSCCEGCNG